MKKFYSFSFLAAGILLANGLAAQCGLTLATTASTVCAGDAVTLTANATPPATTLTTTMSAGNNHRGNMFDIFATNAVTITAFDAHPMGNTTIEIYYRASPYAGFEASSAGWTLIGSAAVTALPMGTPTPVPVPVNVSIPAGQTYSFYVTSTNTAVSLNYSNGVTEGATYVSDANIIFREGVGMEYPFTNGGGVFRPRIWNGVIHYTVPTTTSYLWNTTATTQSINPTIATTTQFNVEVNVTGCPTMYDTVSIQVSTPPVGAGPDMAVCDGTQATLSGSGAVSYTWDNGVTDGVAFTPSATMDYIVTGTDTIGCTSTDTVTITVNNLPLVDAGFDIAVCDGAQASLFGSGADTYTWDNGVIDGVPFTPSATMSYEVTGTDLNGCTDNDTVVVTVNSLPVVTGGADMSVCAGGQITLSGSGAASYSWDNSVTDGVPFTPASTMSYIVAGTDTNGCVNTDTVMIAVNSLPSVSAGADTAVCAGSPVLLYGSGAVSYTWDNSVTDSVMFTPASTMSYIVTGTDTNGCMNTDTVVVTVNVVTVYAGPDSMICAGTLAYLSGSGAVSYTWDNNVTDGVPFTPASTMSYVVTGTDSNGCEDSDTVTIIVNTVNVSTSVLNETITSLAGGASYQWINCSNNMPIAGATAQSYTATANGSYAVIVTESGCSDTSACQTISSVGIEQVSAATEFSVYPNPSGGQVTVTTGNVVAYELSVVDLTGKTLERMKPAGTQVAIDLGAYPAGVYFIRIHTEGGVFTEKVVKQ